MAQHATFNMARPHFVPAGAIKVTDKGSDAVTFLYTTAANRLAAVAFHGRANKPDWHHVFRDATARERAVRAHFEARRSVAARQAERRAAKAKPHGLQVGHVLVASWGYEQTNVDYYQVTARLGSSMVEVRRIGQVNASTGQEPWATGKAMPALDSFTGEPIRRRVNPERASVRIDDVRTAYVWNGRPQSWTAYE